MTSHYFGEKFVPCPPCHISSQVFKPPWNITSQCANPPHVSFNYKFTSILSLLRQKFHLFYRFDLCTLWQDQHCIRKTSKILHTLLSKKLSSNVFSTLLKTETNELRCANAGNDWLRLSSCAWMYRSGRFAILKQKQIIGTFCSIVYLQERFHNTAQKTGMACKCNTGR